MKPLGGGLVQCYRGLVRTGRSDTSRENVIWRHNRVTVAIQGKGLEENSSANSLISLSSRLLNHETVNVCEPPGQWNFAALGLAHR